MLGAIAGDVIGSVHERSRTKTKDFPLLTDESNSRMTRCSRWLSLTVCCMG
jgi:hypothetical protein